LHRQDETGALSDKAPMLELTYIWEDYGAACNFSRFTFLVDDIYATSAQLKDSGITMNLPPPELSIPMAKAGPR
jgi:hypothetical protein